MPDYLCEELTANHTPYHIINSFGEVMAHADILYMTRIQRERFDEEEFFGLKNRYVLNEHVLKKAKKNLKILHPLPRVDEIAPSVDTTPFAAYFQQAKNGIYARQAILSLSLNPQVLQ